MLEWIAKIITLILSLGIVYLIYTIGKKIDPWIGVVASLLVSFSIPFLTFSVVPMTDIPSLFLITLAMYLFIERRLFFAGLVAGLVFATRFPTGLIIGVFGIVTILYQCNYSNLKNSIGIIIKQGLLLLLGFCIVIIPLFASNYYLYGSITLPLTVGQGMITGFMWLYQGGWLFYVKKIVSMNIVSIFIIPAIGFWVVSRKNLDQISRKILMLSIVAIAVFLGYFTFTKSYWC
jgi:4-amino-4-deoxy-L-arabinose transferase-like glycosyltransferase